MRQIAALKNRKEGTYLIEVSSLKQKGGSHRLETLDIACSLAMNELVHPPVQT